MQNSKNFAVEVFASIKSDTEFFVSTSSRSWYGHFYERIKIHAHIYIYIYITNKKKRIKQSVVREKKKKFDCQKRHVLKEFARMVQESGKHWQTEFVLNWYTATNGPQHNMNITVNCS